jgi:hypothetical protein
MTAAAARIIGVRAHPKPSVSNRQIPVVAAIAIKTLNALVKKYPIRAESANAFAEMVALRASRKPRRGTPTVIGV